MRMATWIGVTLIIASSISCARVIINQPLNRQGDSWDLSLRKLTDGPNQYSAGNIRHIPAAGERFIWAHVTLHNNQPVARKFNFDRCDLDSGDVAIVPALIDMDAAINWDADREPEMAANETVTRLLIFSYPRERSPTRLSCAPMVFPLPQF